MRPTSAPLPGARRGEPRDVGPSRRSAPVMSRVARRFGRRSDGGCGPGDRDRFESRADAESPKETAHVVLDRLGTQVELGGDLLRRAAVLEQTEHLDLPGGEMRMWRCG